MKLFNYRISWIALCIMMFAAALDLETTRILLANGYMELNPLYHIMGATGFFSLYIAATALATYILVTIDHLATKLKLSTRRRGALILGFSLTFGAIHLFLGMNQLATILEALR